MIPSSIYFSISSILCRLFRPAWRRKGSAERGSSSSGFVLFAVLYYGFAVARDARAIWVLFGFYGLFMGLTEGIQKAFLATIIPADFKATAFGVYNTAVGLAMFPASLIGGWLWDHVSPSATFYFGAITAGLSAVFFVVFIAVVRRNSYAV